MKKKKKDLIEVIQDIDNHSGSNFKDEKLSLLDLNGKDFSRSDLTNVNFSMSNLADCDFSSAKLDGTNFRGANLYGCYWEGATRNGFQVLKVASIVCGQDSIYGFLCKAKDRETVLINHENRPEKEFELSTATHLSRVLYNLLVNG